MVWLLSSFFIIFLILIIFIYLFIYFYYNFFLSFFLPFLLNHVADSVLVLQPGVRPEPLRWESLVQDIGPPETSQPHVLSISKSMPRDLHLNVKTQLHPTASKLQCRTPHAPCQTTCKTETQPHALTERLCLSLQTPQNTPLDAALPTRKTRSSPTHQNTVTSPLHQEAYTSH